MKKVIATILAAAMLLSLSITAFAAQDPVSTNIINVTGNPITEKGVQKKADDTFTPGQTIYYLLPSNIADTLNNTKNARVTVKKIKNSKMIKSVKLVEKKLTTSGQAYTVPAFQTKDGKAVAVNDSQKATSRNTYIAVELNETTGSDEYKIQFSVTFTAKKAFELKYGTLKDNDVFFTSTGSGDKLVLNATLYVQNDVESGDGGEVTVGTTGKTIKPVGNDYNEITFEAEDTFATLTFKANNNPDKFYAKLSTKWTSTLLAKFKNTDAVIRKFSPATIDCVSRATLALNNPFGEDVDPDDVYIYTADSKNRLKNVTSQFTYNEDDDTFETRTRSLGTYIISDRKVKI